MSKYAYGGIRTKSVREAYVEQLSRGRSSTGSMNRKRETFTGMKPVDDIEFAYRSTPNYLRQLAQQGSLTPTEILTAQNVPRTKSASEITPRNNVNRSISGNPRYKAQEDYYDEIQSMKKDMKTLKDENSNLRAKIRRIEEDNTRKRKEIDTLYDSNKDGDLRRTLSGSTTDRNIQNGSTSNAANVVMSLKQRLFKLESQLKQKENAVDELKSDPRWTKGTELELQNRALLGEVERQKVERLNFIQKNDYVASLDEEKKNAVRKLTKEKDELKEENDSLKRKVRELEKSGHGEGLSARVLDEKDSPRKNEDSKRLKHELDQVNQELKRTQQQLEQVQEKFEQANENLAKMKREKSKHVDDDELEEIKRDRDELREKSNRTIRDLDEVKRDRDQCKKRLDQVNSDLEEIKSDRDRYKKQLDTANEKIERLQEEKSKNNQSGRSSPVPIPLKRPQSPIVEKSSMNSSTTAVRRDPHLFDDLPDTNPKLTTSSPFGSKSNILGGDNNKSRPSSANAAHESAVKTVQASLRGHLARNEMNKTQDPTGSNIALPRDRSSSPTTVNRQSFQPLNSSVSGSKANLQTERNKIGPDNRLSARDQDPTSKRRQSPTPLTDSHQSSATPFDSGAGSKQSLSNEKGKTGLGSRISMRDPDLSSKPRPSSPMAKQNPQSIGSSHPLPRSQSPDNPRPAPRKSPISSKQPIKEPPSDDDDVVAT